MSIQTKLFIGYFQNKELKISLKQSSSWQEAKLTGQGQLFETLHQGKEYIGIFVEGSPTSLQLNEKAATIKSQLQIYCPKLNLDKYSSYIFSQLFMT